MDNGGGNAGAKRDTRFQKGNTFGRGRPRKAPDAVLSALEGLADKTSAEKVQALEGLVAAWIAKASADRDRASLVREAVALFRLGAELRREIRTAGTAEVNVLVVERDRAVAELEERGRLWDAEQVAIIGGLAGFPEARKAVLGSLARVRAHAEHRGPGYPALPPPAGEDVGPPITGTAALAEPAGTAGTGAAEGIPPAESPALPGPEPAEKPAVDGQGRPLPPGWTRGPQGQRLPPGATMETSQLRRRPRFGGYGDEFPG